MDMRWTMAFALAAAVVTGLPAAASADTTIGNAGPPPGAFRGECDQPYLMIPDEMPQGVPSYTVPEDGEISEWQVDVVWADAGTPVTLVVVRPAGEGYTVVGVDRQTLPATAPDVTGATFSPAAPIPVREGDIVGLYGVPGFKCYFDLDGVGSGTVRLIPGETSVSVGQTLTPTLTSKQGVMANVAATVRLKQDVAVEVPAGPATATVGTVTALQATVTNRGPSARPIEFTDTVPDGLTIESAVAGDGRCRVEGQRVSCRIDGLKAGERAPVVITVVPAAAGTYQNRVSAKPADGVPDPDASNDAAAAALTVHAAASAGGGTAAPAPSTARCVVPILKGTPLRVAKPVLRELGCKVGKVKRVHSRKVRKGAVIRTSPAASTQPAGTTVRLRVSRGPRTARSTSGGSQ